MGEKVTVMVLKVNLECPCCYKKVKKILCKFPQIRGQVYNEKDNKVTITVVCCDPERIRDKLCCKGAKVIHSIEIVEPPKPKEPEKPKPKEPEKPKVVVVEEPKKPDKKVTFVEPPKEPEKPKEKPPPQPEKPKPDPPKAPVPVPVPAPAPAPTPPPPEPEPCGYGHPPAPVRTCCGPCSQGYGGGPCYFGYGPPPPCYDGYYGYGHDRPCHVTRCDYYLSEENPQACSIM